MTRVAVVDAGASARGAATENEGVDDGSNLTTSPSHQPAPGETSGRDADAAVEPEVHSGEESEAESVPPLGYASSDDASTAEPDLGDDSGTSGGCFWTSYDQFSKQLKIGTFNMKTNS